MKNFKFDFTSEFIAYMLGVLPSVLIILVFRARHMLMTRSDDALHLQLYTVGSSLFLGIYKIYS